MSLPIDDQSPMMSDPGETPFAPQWEAAKATAEVIGESVMIHGGTIVRAVNGGYLPCVIVWVKPEIYGVQTGITVHENMSPADVVGVLRAAADGIRKQARSITGTNRPLPRQKSQGGLSWPEHSVGG